MAEITLEGIWKIYDGNVEAVKDFNLEVRDGEFLVLVGPSGCGKSTTLRMVAGLEDITRGTVKIGANVVNDVAPKDRNIAMVFQNYALYPHMTVYDNMAFALKLRKFNKNEIARRVSNAAEILGLRELLQRLPKELSGGQRQRVAMGRAIVREPLAFLFDEPLSNLDAKMRVEMRKEILHLHKRLNTTMIYVTHDQVEAMTLGDRIVVMKDGVIMQAAEPLAVYHNPANLFVARFIGAPPMNIFAGTLKRDGDDIVFDGDSIRLPLERGVHDAVKSHIGRKVCLGIRPGAFIPADRASGSQRGISVSAEIDITEMLGEEMLVHLISGNHRFIVSVDPHDRPALEGELTVCPIMQRVHVFDEESGENLTIPGRSTPGNNRQYAGACA